MRTQRWIARLALLLGGVLVGLALVELGFRTWPPAPPTYPRAALPGDKGCLEDHLTLGYAARPGECERDAEGFITLEHPGPTPVLEVLLVGDSISEVPYWLDLALARIGERRGVGTRLRSAGVIGYDACQELEALRLALKRTEPDLVVLQTCANDLLGTAVLTRTAQGNLRFYGPRGAATLPAWTLHSEALSWVLLTGPLLRWQADSRRVGGTSPLEWHVQRDCWAAMPGLLGPEDPPLVAVAMPLLVDLSPTSPLWEQDGEEGHERRVLRWVREAGIPTLDLRPGLEAQGSLVALRHRQGDHVHPGRGEPMQRISEVVEPWLDPLLVERSEADPR